MDPRADLAEAAARVRLHEVLAPVATCVAEDLPLDRLRTLFVDRKLRAVAVVDTAEKLLGLVTGSDLLRAAATGCARDVMTSRAPALPEDAPVSHALALLAAHDLSETPIVTEDGTFVGIVQATDLVRWVAQRMGHATQDLHARAI